jgi:hypothetical protein
MANERYDIEVTDKVDSGIATKLRDIASNATKGDTSVRKLKAALADINDTSVRKLAAASAATTSALAKELAAVRSASAGATRLISGKEKLATASRNVTTAMRSEMTAVSRLTSAYLAQAKAAADARSAGAGVGAAPGSAGQGGGTSGTVGDLKALGDAARSAAAALKTVRAPASGGGSGGGGSAAPAGGRSGMYNYGGGSASVKELGNNARVSSQHLANLSFQLNDIFVSLASGQKPLTVFIQQGSQISQIATQSGASFKVLGLAALEWARIIKTTTAATEAMALATASARAANIASAVATVRSNIAAAETEIALATAEAEVATTANAAALAQTRLAVATAALAEANAAAVVTTQANATAQAELGAAQNAASKATITRLTAFGRAGLIGAAVAATVGTAVALMNKQINDDTSTAKLTEGLGLTSKELRKLKGDIEVTFGDTFKAVFQVAGAAIWGGIGPGVTAVWDTMKEWASWIGSGMKSAINFLIGSMVGAYNTIVKTWDQFPAVFGDMFYSAVNSSIDAINSLVKAAVDGLNSFIDSANGVLPTALQINTLVTSKAIDHVTNAYEGAARKMNKTAQDEIKKAQNVDYLGAAYGAVADQAVKNARKRIKKLAEDKGYLDPEAAKKPTEDKTAENRARALTIVNTKLDDELLRMRSLKDERAVQARMDQIEQDLLSKKIKLDATERAGILAKVQAVEAFKYQQAEMDRIVEEAQGPQRTYNAALAAANDLLARGIITRQQLSQEQVKANQTLAQATDPLFGIKTGLAEAERATGLYGDAVERNNQLEGIRAALLAKGIILGQNSTAAINAEVAALMRKGDVLRNNQFVQSQVGQIVDPMLERDRTIENKQAMYDELQRLREADVLSEEQAARAKYALDAKFNEMRLGGYGDLMGSLAGLASSGNKKLAAIGKAAAIAQATMDGYVAIQKALASAPPPANYIAAAATGITTAINIAGIASTNVGSYNTGGSFMVKGAQGVDKNNINMNVSRGERVTVETKAQQKNGGGSTSVVIHNYGSDEATTTETNGADGTKLIEVFIGKVAADIRKGGTPVSKAIQDRFGLNPARGNG